MHSSPPLSIQRSLSGINDPQEGIHRNRVIKSNEKMPLIPKSRNSLKRATTAKNTPYQSIISGKGSSGSLSHLKDPQTKRSILSRTKSALKAPTNSKLKKSNTTTIEQLGVRKPTQRDISTSNPDCASPLDWHKILKLMKKQYKVKNGNLAVKRAIRAALSDQPQQTDLKLSGEILCLAQSSARIAAGSSDTQIYILELKNRQLGVSEALEGHSGAVLCLDYDPNGQTLLSGGQEGRIVVWSLDLNYSPHFRKIQVLEDHRAPVRALAWIPELRVLLSGAEEANLFAYREREGELTRNVKLARVQVLTPLKEVYAITVSQGGMVVAVGGSSGAGEGVQHQISIFRLKKSISFLYQNMGDLRGIEAKRGANGVGMGVLSRSAALNAKFGADENFRTPQRLSLKTSINSPVKRSLSASKPVLRSTNEASNSSNAQNSSKDSKDQNLAKKSKPQKTEKNQLFEASQELSTTHGKPIRSLKLTGDSKILVCGTDYFGIYIFLKNKNFGNYKLWQSIMSHTDSITSVDLSLNGLYLVAASKDRFVKIYKKNIKGTFSLKSEFIDKSDRSEVTAVRFVDRLMGVVSSSRAQRVSYLPLEGKSEYDLIKASEAVSGGRLGQNSFQRASRTGLGRIGGSKGSEFANKAQKIEIFEKDEKIQNLRISASGMVFVAASTTGTFSIYSSQSLDQIADQKVTKNSQTQKINFSLIQTFSEPLNNSRHPLPIAISTNDHLIATAANKTVILHIIDPETKKQYLELNRLNIGSKILDTQLIGPTFDVLTATNSNMIYIHRLKPQKQRYQIFEVLVGHSGPVGSISVSGSGLVMASGSYSKEVMIWSRESLDNKFGLPQVFRGHSRKLLKVLVVGSRGGVFKPGNGLDGRVIVSMCAGGKLKVYRKIEVFEQDFTQFGVKGHVIDTVKAINPKTGVNASSKTWKYTEIQSFADVHNMPCYAESSGLGDFLFTKGKGVSNLKLWYVHPGGLIPLTELRTCSYCFVPKSLNYVIETPGDSRNTLRVLRLRQRAHLQPNLALWKALLDLFSSQKKFLNKASTVRFMELLDSARKGGHLFKLEDNTMLHSEANILLIAVLSADPQIVSSAFEAYGYNPLYFGDGYDPLDWAIELNSAPVLDALSNFFWSRKKLFLTFLTLKRLLKGIRTKSSTFRAFLIDILFLKVGGSGGSFFGQFCLDGGCLVLPGSSWVLDSVSRGFFEGFGEVEFLRGVGVKEVDLRCSSLEISLELGSKELSWLLMAFSEVDAADLTEPILAILKQILSQNKTFPALYYSLGLLQFVLFVCFLIWAENNVYLAIPIFLLNLLFLGLETSYLINRTHTLDAELHGTRFRYTRRQYTPISGSIAKIINYLISSIIVVLLSSSLVSNTNLGINLLSNASLLIFSVTAAQIFSIFSLNFRLYFSSFLPSLLTRLAPISLIGFIGVAVMSLARLNLMYTTGGASANKTVEEASRRFKEEYGVLHGNWDLDETLGSDYNSYAVHFVSSCFLGLIFGAFLVSFVNRKFLDFQKNLKRNHTRSTLFALNYFDCMLKGLGSWTWSGWRRPTFYYVIYEKQPILDELGEYKGRSYDKRVHWVNMEEIGKGMDRLEKKISLLKGGSSKDEKMANKELEGPRRSAVVSEGVEGDKRGTRIPKTPKSRTLGTRVGDRRQLRGFKPIS